MDPGRYDPAHGELVLFRTAGACAEASGYRNPAVFAGAMGAA